MLKNFESFSLPKIEEQVLAFWKDHKTFEKSISQRSAKQPFVFYEGPPTANGRPGMHHVLARVFKDIICRYQTMRGFHVPRKGGWDTHGLPVEIEVEKQLGLKSKKDIEAYGVERFNEACRASVWKYQDEWERLTERMGFWLDMEHPYITYENSYMESLWWILKEIYRKKFLFEGHKVVPWCPRCGTVLSSHELAQGYQEVKDESVYVKFKLEKGQKIEDFTTDENTYILSWTTTPWTLPGNVALAVGSEIKYVISEVTHPISQLHLKQGDRIVFADTIDTRVRIFGDYKTWKDQPNSTQEFPYTEDIKLIKGGDLIGLVYKSLFDVRPLQTETAYRIYLADFVTTTDGTGVVHTAVMYGEDDYQLGMKVGLPQYHTVDEQGKFTADVPEFAGRTVKHRDSAIERETTEVIIAALEKKGALLRRETVTHEYPFCWRCSTPLIYYARTSWFIKMSALRRQLLAANRTINWVPAHLKEGRFGEWLREVKDWAISRERYWGTPLPLWVCEACGHTHAVGSVEDLESRLPKARNRYILMRHGVSENVVTRIINNSPKELDRFPLTATGRMAVQEKTEQLTRKERIDLIFSSDFLRARETADIIGNAASVKVSLDARLRELDTGVYEGGPVQDFWNFYSSPRERFSKAPEGGETMRNVARRAFDFIEETEKKYEGKTILVVTHESVIWSLETVMRGWSEAESANQKEARGSVGYYVEPAGFYEVPLRNLPRDKDGFMDLHRPYIDEVIYPCAECKKMMRRVPDVVDVWFDSGAMPFAQAHWPFEQEKGKKIKEKGNSRKLEYPADYISEAMDQTRGWFYTLLAVATLLGRKAPYRNVISLGLVLDRNGQKMSKSKGNIVDPWATIEKHGVDTIRWLFYTMNSPGEPKRFDERDLTIVSRELFGILYNSFIFWDTYGSDRQQTDKQATNASSRAVARGKQPKATHVLDQWILARLNETIRLATTALEAYDPGSAARAVGELVGDLSRWFIRRSRRRFQYPESEMDRRVASAVLGYALVTIAKLLAPFTPFFAEALWQSVQKKKEKRKKTDSVHLADWPTARKRQTTKDRRLIADMAAVRNAASAGLAARAAAGVKVRQPLASLTLRDATLRGKRELLALLADEVNVKEVRFDVKLAEPVSLDTTITHGLREEGWRREFIRAVQGLRQDAKLRPSDTITLAVEVPEELRFILTRDQALVCREVRATTLSFGAAKQFTAEATTTVDGMPVRMWVGKVKG